MSPNELLPVDVLVVNYRTRELTREAVAALSGAVSRVLVWDNSGELTDDDVPGAALSSTGSNLLYADASNRLYQQGDSPLVLLLNPDARCTAADLTALVAALGDQGAWGAAPRLVGADGQDQNYRRRLPTTMRLMADRLPFGRHLLRPWWRRLYCRDLDPAESGTVEQPAAACLLLRRSAVGPVLFDTAYPLFGNDLDLCRRLGELGSCRYVADVVVTHVGGASFRTVGPRGRGWLRLEYDKALRLYARRHLRAWWVLEPLFWLRRLAIGAAGGSGMPQPPEQPH